MNPGTGETRDWVEGLKNISTKDKAIAGDLANQFMNVMEPLIVLAMSQADNGPEMLTTCYAILLKSAEVAQVQMQAR